jgi:hypothetical protein
MTGVNMESRTVLDADETLSAEGKRVLSPH